MVIIDKRWEIMDITEKALKKKSMLNGMIMLIRMI